MPGFIVLSRPHTNVLLLSLARPPMNAFSEPYWRELGSIFDRIKRGEVVDGEPGEIRVVVLGSALDRAFTAGLDRE